MVIVDIEASPLTPLPTNRANIMPWDVVGIGPHCAVGFQPRPGANDYGCGLRKNRANQPNFSKVKAPFMSNGPEAEKASSLLSPAEKSHE
jgi:hypothetical protein